ncbi:hypothetical protein [Maritalea porphyrae]|uniref:hypothetical protein n=1 Tax=Maritalea porphyrae TaxID=880732 RepID=UPI0022B008E0|nr:hypothetical protein [Maritalea porphyrae]MCZ4271100.1 hypothetical protein [Maritalea porphyrae]
MKIFKHSSEQVAERSSKTGKFVCGLKKKNTEDSEYVEFQKIEDAATWLCNNPTWGIRMNPGWSLIHRDIVIDRDASLTGT